MAITRVTGQSNTNGGAASTSVIFTYPATPTQGNLLVARFSYRLSTTTVTGNPTGWQKAGSTYANGNIKLETWWKIAGASEPTVHTWTLSDSVKSAGSGEEFNATGGWPANPVGVGTGSSGASGTTGLSTGTTGTSTGGAAILVLGAHACDTNATWSAHSGTNVTVTENAEVSSTGGPTSSRNTTSAWSGTTSTNNPFTVTATLSASNNWAAQIQTFYEQAGSNGNASGSVGTVTATTPAGSSTGGASSTGAVGTLTITAPAGSVSGNAATTGDLATVSVTAPEATASAVTNAAGDVGTVTLLVVDASATGGAAASGDVGTVTTSSVDATVSASASTSGDIGTVSVTAPDGTAAGVTVASGTVGTVQLTAPDATVQVSVVASGDLGTVSLTAVNATVSASSVASGAVGTITLSKVFGNAYTGVTVYRYPNEIISMTGLTGAYTDIDESPDAPDGSWLLVA